MKRFVLFYMIVFLLFGMGYPTITRAEEYPFIFGEEEDEITGTIENINYDISMITIKYYTDEEMINYRKDDFYVLKEAVIERDKEKIALTDLSPGNEITVHFRIGEDGMREITHIWVKTL